MSVAASLDQSRVGSSTASTQLWYSDLALSNGQASLKQHTKFQFPSLPSTSYSPSRPPTTCCKRKSPSELDSQRAKKRKAIHKTSERPLSCLCPRDAIWLAPSSAWLHSYTLVPRHLDDRRQGPGLSKRASWPLPSPTHVDEDDDDDNEIDNVNRMPARIRSCSEPLPCSNNVKVAPQLTSSPKPSLSPSPALLRMHLLASLRARDPTKKINAALRLRRWALINAWNRRPEPRPNLASLLGQLADLDETTLDVESDGDEEENEEEDEEEEDDDEYFSWYQDDESQNDSSDLGWQPSSSSTGQTTITSFWDLEEEPNHLDNRSVSDTEGIVNLSTTSADMPWLWKASSPQPSVSTSTLLSDSQRQPRSYTKLLLPLEASHVNPNDQSMFALTSASVCAA